jgi:hypothetical protein
MRRFLLLVLLLTTAARAEEPARLHFIVFADTQDPAIGEANTKTFNYLTQIFAPEVAKQANLQLALTAVLGDAFTVETWDRTLSTLTVQPKDVVFFYFAGHGWNNRLNDFPSLIFGRAQTDRSSIEKISRNLYDNVYTPIRAKRPRLVLVVSDACNNTRSDNPPDPGIVSRRKINVMSPASSSAEQYRRLFLGWQGGVVLSSSQPDQYSFSDKSGGWMSVAWQNTAGKLLTEQTKTPIDWRQFVEAVKRETESIATQNSQVQNPQFQVDLQPIIKNQPVPPAPTPALASSSTQAPCPPLRSQVNERALAGIRSDLPLLLEMYERINTNNATTYAQEFQRFYVNQKAFYDRLGDFVFYRADQLPPRCQEDFRGKSQWVRENAAEINERYQIIEKYSKNPRHLVAQARSDLPSLIRRLQEILEELD